VLDEPLRSVGEHKVTVHLVGRLRPQVTVVIEAEAAEEEEAPANAVPAADSEGDTDAAE